MMSKKVNKLLISKIFIRYANALYDWIIRRVVNELSAINYVQKCYSINLETKTLKAIKKQKGNVKKQGKE